MYKNFRFYLVYEPISGNISNPIVKINKLMYYPDIKFCIKPSKLVPAKFIANSVYEQILKFKSKYDYGYLSLSK